jgi:hypothetical protein
MSGKLKYILTLLIIPLMLPLPVYAVNSSSTNYKVNQILFGAGGTLNDTSTNYSAQVTVGETGEGNVSSTNYQAYAGFNTTEKPYLEAVVTGTNLNLGVLSKSSTATATATFYVRAWDSSGYIVQTNAAAPTNGSYNMHTNTTPTANTIGTEQFGMNLVANTSPVSFGANPSQTTAFAYGAAYGNYATTNQYAYNNGDTIAQATKNTSSTIYTISYIFNISGSTPGGQYVFNQNLVVTGYY